MFLEIEWFSIPHILKSLIKLKCGGKGLYQFCGAISAGQVSGLIYSLERNSFVGGKSNPLRQL